MKELAMKLKARNIKIQERFIEQQITYICNHPRDDGDTSYRYAGQVLPEVREYFRAEGFDVERVTVPATISKGLPVYLFTVSDDVIAAEDAEDAEDKAPVA